MEGVSSSASIPLLSMIAARAAFPFPTSFEATKIYCANESKCSLFLFYCLLLANYDIVLMFVLVEENEL